MNRQTNDTVNASFSELTQAVQKAREQIRRIIIGQDEVIEQCLIVILTGHHALLEGAPGLAKTLLVKTLASVLHATSDRIQFTPDLMPADITGTNIYNLKTQEFTLVKGPVFTQFLLADEINRAPAKTQSALLQAMQERCVTIDRDLHQLSGDFTVFATQNPIEHEGTYPLPAAQKDRFMLKIAVDYPAEADELELARQMLSNENPEQRLASGVIEPVLGPDELGMIRASLREVTVRDELVQYIVNIIRQTRQNETILVGASPRATQALLLASRAAAVLEGRDFVTPDDIQRMARPVLEHRLMLRPEFEIEGLTMPEAIDQLLQSLAVPR